MKWNYPAVLMLVYGLALGTTIKAVADQTDWRDPVRVGQSEWYRPGDTGPGTGSGYFLADSGSAQALSRGRGEAGLTSAGEAAARLATGDATAGAVVSGDGQTGSGAVDVPEPATMLLMGAGIACLAEISRRRNKRSKAITRQKEDKN